jgi:hypothetical protein
MLEETPMDRLRTYFDEELATAADSEARQDRRGAWAALERAHILSQSRVNLHLQAHWRMFVLACKTGDGAEILGQLFRLLVAGPGSALGRAPTGNTGRSSVSAFVPMAIPDELRKKLLEAGVTLPSEGASS